MATGNEQQQELADIRAKYAQLLRAARRYANSKLRTVEEVEELEDAVDALEGEKGDE